MIYQPTQFSDFLDWEPLQADAIELSPSQINRAVELSQGIDGGTPANPDQQWQRYLDALALLGFEQWLRERSPDLTLQQTQCNLLSTAPNRFSSGVWNLQVGNFSVGLVTLGSLTDSLVALPSEAIATRAPQFYVLMEVIEEQDLVRVYGYLRSDQLRSHQQAQSLTLASDGSYALPLDWFTPAPDKLLLLLRALDAQALPAATSQSTNPAAATQTAAPLIPDSLAETTDRAIPLTSPQLPNPLINTAHWLRNQIDAVAEELSWVLMPPLAAAMRWRNRELQDLTRALENRGLNMPASVVGAYADLAPQAIPMRLHTLIWTLPDSGEWVLLAVLGTQPGSLLPAGIRLRVRDEQQVLAEQTLASDNQDGYLYVQVVGAVGETFGITIELPDGTQVNLPLLTFSNEVL